MFGHDLHSNIGDFTVNGAIYYTTDPCVQYVGTYYTYRYDVTLRRSRTSSYIFQGITFKNNVCII